VSIYPAIRARLEDKPIIVLVVAALAGEGSRRSLVRQKAVELALGNLIPFDIIRQNIRHRNVEDGAARLQIALKRIAIFATDVECTKSHLACFSR
jgi:hypothetical protein